MHKNTITFVISLLFIIIVVSTGLNAAEPDVTLDRSRDIDYSSNVDMGVEYDHIWHGVPVVTGTAITTGIHLDLYKGLFFGIDSFIDIAKNEMPWSEFKLSYQRVIRENIALEFGVIHYFKGGDTLVYPSTDEGFLKVDYYLPIEKSRFFDFFGAAYYDFNKGKGLYLEVGGRYSALITNYIYFGPSITFSFNFNNQVVNSYLTTGQTMQRGLEIYLFSEFVISKLTSINLRGGAELTTINYTILNYYNTVITPFLKFQFMFKI